MHKYKTLAALVATALLSLAGTASAQVAVTGGGASLPADLYIDSILPANFSYAVTGSGTGKTAFLTNNSSLFSATGTVHFAGSDSILSAGDLATYNSTYNVAGDPNRYGALLQFPSVATSVTIPFNKAGAALNISDANLCGIFSGQITSWQGVAGSGRTGAINVVYRNESSGTSELLTRFLTTVCASQNLAGTTLKQVNGVPRFSVQSTFKNLFVNNTAPATFVAAPADGGTSLYNAVFAATGRIGYVGPDVIPDLTDATRIATLRGFSPDEVSVQETLATIAPPSTVDDLADPEKWVPVFTNPADGYPIAGYTNLVIGQCYRDSNVTTALRGYLARQYSPGTAGLNDAAIRAHGFIPLTQVWRDAIRNNLVLASADNGLGNTTDCNGIGRPQ